MDILDTRNNIYIEHPENASNNSSNGFTKSIMNNDIIFQKFIDTLGLVCCL